MIVILIIFILHWYLSLFVQTFFLHRYASHSMFKMHPYVEKFFFLITMIAQGSSFLQPAAYALMHRKHHEHSDTERDPHSPVGFTNIFSFMFRTAKEYQKYSKIVAENKYTDKDLPRWPLLEKIGDSYFTRISFAIGYIGLYTLFSPSLLLYLLIPVHILMGPIHGFIVNWFGHRLGYRNFKKLHDNSRNTLFIDILMMGELYQNNHHKRPNQSNFAYKWFEFDFGYIIMKLFHKLRIITII